MTYRHTANAAPATAAAACSGALCSGAARAGAFARRFTNESLETGDAFTMWGRPVGYTKEDLFAAAFGARRGNAGMSSG